MKSVCPYPVQTVRESLREKLQDPIPLCAAFLGKLIACLAKALGQSCQSLGLSCCSPILTRADAELALERPGEIREIVEADGVSDFLGQCA